MSLPKIKKFLIDTINKNLHIQDDSKVPSDRFVLCVGGFMNELTKPRPFNYYYDSQNVFKEYKMITSYTGPPSSKTVDENMHHIKDKVDKCYAKYKKRIIGFGHSKGAAELLYFVLTNPEYMYGPNSIIDVIISIQGAIKGSPLAKEVEQKGVLYNLVKLVFKQNLSGLSTTYMKKIFDRAFKQYDQYFVDRAYKEIQDYLKTTKEVDEVQATEIQKIKDNIMKNKQNISDRIFYVRTKAEIHGVGIDIVHMSISDKMDNYPEHTEHDGLLPVANQYDERIGVDLGILPNYSHLDLTSNGIVVKTSNKVRQNMTKNILRHIYS